MLVSTLLGLMSGATVDDVRAALAARFTYVPDAQRFPGVFDNWPTRAEVVDDLIGNNGHLLGDCDDCAFAAAYALHDLGLGARVVSGICETGEGHMVCEDAAGNVIDNRNIGRLMTWDELEQIGYRSTQMNALDFEQSVGRWVFVKVGPDGRRDYS